MLLSLLTFILILGLLVFVHELGHFMVAKWFGMRVDEFGLGFPPRLFSRQKGETTYSLNAIPLGGFVRIHGESMDPNDDTDANSFHQKPVGARILVLIAGVIMNLLLAFLALCIAFSVGFVSISQSLDKVPGATVLSGEVGVYGVQPGSPAEKIKLQPGDIIEGVIPEDSTPPITLKTATELQNAMATQQKSGHLHPTILYKRGDQELRTQVEINPTGPALGVAIGSQIIARVPVLQSPIVAVKEIKSMVVETWAALRGFISGLLFHGHLDASVSGPVGIYQATNAARHQGMIAVVFLAISLSVNLALLNILPFPPLDGGKLLFALIELVFRRRVIRHQVENTIAMAGMLILMGLIAIISINDIRHLF
jgi:regulator of sigma E protease